MADVIKYRFVLRRGLAADWTAKNEVLLQGEFGLELDTGKKKVGDGVTPWNGLPYDGGGTLSTVEPLQGGGNMAEDLVLSIAPATRASAGSMSAADKVLLDATHGDGTSTQVGATLMQTGSSVAAMPTSSSAVSKSIVFDVPYDTVKGVFIEPGVGSVSASGDTPTHYVTKSETGFTVNFKAAANITKDIPFDWMAFGVVSGSGIAALSGTFKRVRIGVPYSSDLLATGGDGTYYLYGGTGLVSGSLPAGLSLSVVSSNLLRLSGTCTEPSPTTLAGVVGVATGDGQVATSSQTFTVADAFDPADLFQASERGIWIDPQDLSTMFQDTAGTVPVTAAGQKVARINDKSGNGNHLTQSTSGNQPYLRHDGSHYYLELVGSTPTYLLAPNTNQLAPRTNSMLMAVATRYTSPTTSQYIAARSLQGPGANRYWMSQGVTGDNASFNYASSSGDIAVPTMSNGSGANTVVSGTVDRSAGSAVVRVNSVSGAPASFSPDTATDRNTAYRFIVGVYPNASDTGVASGTGATGRLYGLVLRFAPIDDVLRSDLEWWMGQQCGVAL